MGYVYSFIDRYNETRYNETIVLFSLKDLYEKMVSSVYGSVYDLRYFNPKRTFIGYRHSQTKNKEEVIYLGSVINIKKISIEERKEIEELIDKEIIKNEEFIRSQNTTFLTGWLGITSKGRNWAIDNEVMKKELSFKTFKELDLEKFKYE